MVTKYNPAKVTVSPVTPVNERTIYTEKVPATPLKLSDLLAGAQAIVKQEARGMDLKARMELVKTQRAAQC